MASSSIITARKLIVAYGNNHVISDANFTVQSGDFVCVVGANGSGKSTLIKALLGLIAPAAGEVIYGDDIQRNSIGYLPQEPHLEQRFPATVFEIVLSGTLGRLGGRLFYRQEDKTRALNSLKTLRIDKLQHEAFANLSGGQKQKVLLARALAATSELLILDEPSNNLDHASRADFYKTLQRLNRDGITIIMITHDLDADDLIGNRIFSIEHGKVSSWTTADYLRRFR